MKKDNKFEIGLMFTLGFITLLILGIYFIIEILNKKNTYTLITYPFSIIECVKWNCKDISKDLTAYNNLKYNTYIDGQNYNTNKLFYDGSSSKMYIFNKDNKNIFKNGEYALMYEGSPEITQYYFETNTLEDNEVINELSDLTKQPLNKNNIQYITHDFDGDKDNETIYLINSGFMSNKYFNILVYKDKSKYYILSEEYPKELLESNFIKINNVIDIFNDNKIEFILTKEYYDQVGHCNILYRLKNNKFIPVNECEIVK